MLLVVNSWRQTAHARSRSFCKECLEESLEEGLEKVFSVSALSDQRLATNRNLRESTYFKNLPKSTWIYLLLGSFNERTQLLRSTRSLNFDKVLSFRSRLKSRLRRCRISAQSEHYDFSCSKCASGRDRLMTSQFRKTNTTIVSGDVQTTIVQIFSKIWAPLFIT